MAGAPKTEGRMDLCGNPECRHPRSGRGTEGHFQGASRGIPAGPCKHPQCTCARFVHEVPRRSVPHPWDGPSD